MKERWKMSRIGFVNFWLYDEEDFAFNDGKLLLRGQNGSGKSITTQSFIPFVLDGDRTPSRLDPFGSSDRKMEYYFLGEEGKDESTGYLFLEFKKEETGEYRTIGIGQRAKRGKPMDFWGFVILDGKRIGYDFWLYKEVGSSKIPYDKRELKSALREENFYTDSQSEYKKHVNQYIFGFRKEEQYEQFIKLLVKVRAPKLSKEFKPTKVYEILNDSLQTLTDEDLRAMVEAMEKMDEIQDSLDMLKRAFDDVRIIRNEYTRYNQYMLARKAQAYQNKRKEVSDLQKKLEVQERKLQNAEQEKEQKSSRSAELEECRKLAETEKNGLLDMNLEEIDQKLEYAKDQKKAAEEKERYWEQKAQEYQTRIWNSEQQLTELKSFLEQKQQSLQEICEELEEEQEILQWESYEKAMQIVRAEETVQTEEIVQSLSALKKTIEEGRRAIQRYEEAVQRYDEIAAQMERLRAEKTEKEQKLEQAREFITESLDNWITEIFEKEKMAEIWKPDHTVLTAAEQKIRNYETIEDASAVQELLRNDYERQRQHLLEEKAKQTQAWKDSRRELAQVEEEQKKVQQQEELEPARTKSAEQSRLALQEKNILAVPFYKTVEFSENLNSAACARLEAQLQQMGLLDALVISEEDSRKLRKTCPELLDTVLTVRESGASSFSGLRVSETLSQTLKETVQRILSNIYEEENGKGIYLGKDGWFRQGVLTGRADKEGEAEYLGVLARKRRREQKLRELAELQKEIENRVQVTGQKLEEIEKKLEFLQDEYQKLPDFSEINAAFALEKECRLTLQIAETEYGRKEKQEEACREEKNQRYQSMLQNCKSLPYGRTEEAYEEAADAAEAVYGIWQEIRQLLLQIMTQKSAVTVKQEIMERDAEQQDEAYVEKRGYRMKVREAQIQIDQFEEYLNSPEIVEKAKRLKKLQEELRKISEESSQLDRELAVLEAECERIRAEMPEKKEELQKELLLETRLRNYFEEELDLKLLMNRENKTLPECAKEAVRLLRENDKNRDASDVFQTLIRVFQQHNGSLTSYGTTMEKCFGAEDGLTEEMGNLLRSRVRIVSTWNGKKVYLDEFYTILKAAIEETELLIQRKDRELFEDILSQTISQQLTDRIAESRKWVQDMSKLMKEMDTSMGLCFSLDWKPRKAENEAELDITELEEILLRDRGLLTLEDIEKVAAHFRSKIRTEKMRLEEEQSVINYMDLVRDALDYRKWFEFHMYFRRGKEQKKPLTNAAFNRFSGGEKAMAMYVPLFAAVNAQYQKAEKKDHPRMIALDEAFAGVDDKNISSMFELVEKLDFDYIMNSQALWGCFETVHALQIAELLRPLNSKTVSVIYYSWNGKERVLDE